ncbi:serine O-acetyltransferase [Salinivibrio costicola]|uniref:Serine acetyltransferase n=1 Tax=Salinivibrio costicola TaxID=51367 RepID=A0ABX6K8G9_SALCS|nr:serine acetyltransferase [Salinivibrio costicola]QIR06485.1 serine acetyltransferase [Salinivibrio costicola]
MKLSNCIIFIYSDLFRYHGEISFSRFIKEFFFNTGFKTTFFYRLAKCEIKVISFFAKIFLYRCRIKYGIHISHKVDCGYGLYFGHGMNVVINPNTKIGNNVNFSQFTTVGSHDKSGAMIGDNVYIGPNVSIVGPKRVGSNSVIGASTVVTKDVESNTIFAGNPGHYKKHIEHNFYVNNRWCIKG